MLSEILPKKSVLILKISLLVRNQEPRNGGTSHGKRRTDEENALNALVRIAE